MAEHKFEHQYQAYFCEENIWHLAKAIKGTVLFISNMNQRIAVFEQTLASHPDDAVIWDYHVVLAARGQIYDFDSQLDFPCPAQRYLEHTFRPQDHDYSISQPKPAASGACGQEKALHEPAPTRSDQHKHQHFIRLIPSEDFRRYFHSDRSHMKNEEGHWAAIPPTWPPILNNSNQARSLDRLKDFSADQNEWLSLSELLEMVYRKTGCGRAASLMPPTPS
jgi:hypothetical protein